MPATRLQEKEKAMSKFEADLHELAEQVAD